MSLKGWLGELGLSFAARRALNKAAYRRLNNVVVRVASDTTQIDHLVVSRHGIFVIETKNLKGWIFGDEKSSKWTQSIFGRNYSFQNPLRQNFRHIKVLQELLDLPTSSFHSVVCFVDRSCEFRTPLPSNVILGKPFDYIKSKTEIILTDDKIAEVMTMISSAALAPTSFLGRLTGETNRVHRASLRRRYSSTTTCPKCGGGLVLRSTRGGVGRRSRFYGCKRYPACRYTRRV